MPTVTLRDVGAAARFLVSLVSSPSRPIGLGEAHASLRERFARREADFLALIDLAIYRNPASPYRRLLELAGCERDDFEQLVHKEGIEGALAELYRRGVYLTVDELKGRRPAHRARARSRLAPTAGRQPGALVRSARRV